MNGLVLEQWQPWRENREFGLQSHELEVEHTKVHLNAERTYFYLSGGLTHQPRFWLRARFHSEGPELIRLRDVPFRTGRQFELATPGHPLAERYMERFGWNRIPDTYAFLTQSGKRDLLEPGDWLWRPREKATWNVMTDREYRERFGDR